jgi:hypothetical protein
MSGKRVKQDVASMRRAAEAEWARAAEAEWAAAKARELVAKWEHGDEAHRQWLRNVAIPDIAAALREARLMATEVVS